MKTTDFFHDVPSIRMFDPLANLLGAAAEGVLEYSYEDVVKLAGHSCPTVAGAFLMTRHGLKALYGDEMPIRGNIRVLMRGTLGEGTVGVIANVVSMITGATDTGGFHGLGGNFDRRGLLSYKADIDGEIAFERVDTLQRVVVNYTPACVPADPQMAPIMGQILSGSVDGELRHRFAQMWQDRVKRILIGYGEDPRLIQCHYVKQGETV